MIINDNGYGIWLMMVNNNLVGGFFPTPLKNDGVKVSWDDYSIPNCLTGKSFKIPWFQSPPTRGNIPRILRR